MMMYPLLLLFGLFLLPTVSAATVSCYYVASSNMSNPNTATTVSCSNTYSCLKTVDYTYKTVTKGCGSYLNCTNSLLVSNSEASCTNTSNILTCCCYGETCNTAPLSASSLLLPLALLLAVLALSPAS